MSPLFRILLLTIFFVAALLSGCAATSSSNTFTDPGQRDAAFSNFLVIGVAGNYNSRAQFERSVVSGLKAEGASASAFHVAAGGNKPLSRELVRDLIARGAFDAVVVTRVLDSESDVTVRSAVTGTKVTRKDEGALHLFRYDYEELNDPLTLSVDMQGTFATDLYSAADESLVWTKEWEGPRSDNVGILIDETAKVVVRQLRRAGSIAR